MNLEPGARDHERRLDLELELRSQRDLFAQQSRIDPLTELANRRHFSNVLADAEIRQGIKEYANWPTIPQLYVNGEFVGGSDIMREMYQSGELQKILESASQKA